MADRKPSLCELIRGLRESIPQIVNWARTGLKPNFEGQMRDALFYTNHYRCQATDARTELLVVGIDPKPLKDFMNIDGQAKHPEYDRRFNAVMQFLYDTLIEVEALERRRKAERAALPVTVTSAAAATQPADGPAPPNRFCWQGSIIELGPTPWRLLDFIWVNRNTPETDAIDAVWEHDSLASAGDGALKSALRRINGALAELSCPLHAGRKAGYITLN